MRRALLSETIDPDGALPHWMSPDVARCGWDVHRLPTQEAIHLLGPGAYADLVVDVVTELRPHVLVVHPPVDFLSGSACAAIRATGTRLVGLGFDDALYASAWSDREGAGFRDLAARFDVWATTAMAGPTVDAGALPVRWALSPECVADNDPGAPAHDVVLVGRWTAERAALIAALDDAGIAVAAYGQGWPSGPVSRARMLGLWRKARCVLTPSDGRDMLKGRFLEAAFVGASQLIEACSDLPFYFREQGTAVGFRGAAECVARARGAPTPPPELGAYRWTRRWPELMTHVPASPLDAGPGSSRTLARLFTTLGHAAEARGSLALAAACFAAWSGERPDDPAARLACARVAFTQERHANVLAALALLASDVGSPAAVDGLDAFAPAHGQGTGLGLSGALDPWLESTALQLASHLALGQPSAALELARRQPTHRLAALRELLARDDTPEHAALWSALGHGPPTTR